MKKYPFKFLDSYGKEDVSIFFGRDEEIQDLYEMVFQSPIILVHGMSGTGKTSLIQCGLATKFEQHEWLPLTVRRGTDINKSLQEVLDKENSLTVSTDLAWLNEFAEPGVSTSEKITERAVVATLKSVCRNVFKPVYLIFDQFEELFIFGSVAEQKEFIATIKDILLANQPVRMIFSIREEYLGELSEFEKAIPLITKKKLRVEPMGFGKVRQFIHGVTKQEKHPTNVTLKDGDEERIPEAIFKIIKGESRERGIQLPYLQVFLDKLYLNITNDKDRNKDAEIGIGDVEHIKDIGDVLRDLLEEQTKAIAAELHPKYPTLTVDTIWKILSPFVTLKGTKQPTAKPSLYAKLPDIQPGIINEVIEEFVNGRILRYSENSGLYEISHDSLGLPIALKRSAEEIAILEIRRLIESQSSFKGEARLFNDDQLNYILPHLPKMSLSAEEQKLIDDSVAAINREKNKKRKKLVVTFCAIGVVIAVLVSMLVYALQLKNTNNKQAKENAEVLSILKMEQRKVLENTAIAEAKFKEDSLDNYRRLKHLTDSVNKQIALSTSKYNKFSRDVFVGKINQVISLMKSPEYSYFDMKNYTDLIDSNSGSQGKTYISILRNSINTSNDLNFKVRALFYLYNATGKKAILKEISNMLTERLSNIDEDIIREVNYQTGYRTQDAEVFDALRMKIFEQLLTSKRNGRLKLGNADYLYLLPVSRYYMDTDRVVKDQTIIPASVLHYENIENYYDAISIAFEMINGDNVLSYEKEDALRYLSSFNKFLFCCKLPAFLSLPELPGATRAAVLRMLPDPATTAFDDSWKKFGAYNVPTTVENAQWQAWASDHPDIMRLHSENNLEEFRQLVTEYWKAHKTPYTQFR